MKKLVHSFKELTREQILALPEGEYGDYELLDVSEFFADIEDFDREMAVYELILCSPVVDEMVAYGGMYTDLVNYYRREEKHLQAIQWCFAMIAFSEQHEEGMNRINHRIQLADIYLEKGDFNVGLAMYTQMLYDDPGDAWLYNNLGIKLPLFGLSSLAIEALDRGLVLVAKSDPNKLKGQFEDLRAEAVKRSSSEPSRLDEIDREVLASYREALKLPVEVSDNNEVSYPPQITRLREIGVDRDEEAYAEIIARGQLFIPPLIQLAYDPESKTGSAHAVSILRTLRDEYPDELLLLSDWLDQAEGDWQLELLSTSIGKIGGYTNQDLKSIAEDTSLDSHIRSYATEALVERAQRRPKHRDEIILFFRTLLTRPEAYGASEEAFLARLVGDCVDLEARELYPEIRRVFDEDRLEPGWIDLDDVHTEWGMDREQPPVRRKDGLYIPLVCKDCGRTREHFTEYVLVDLNSLGEDDDVISEYDAHILDHEVECPKCGSLDRYELGPLAHLRLSGPDEILAALQTQSGEKPRKFKPNPRVLYFRPAAFGESMHPLDGLDEYRRRIALNPDDAMLHAGMGSLLRVLMRYSEALEAQRHAYQLAPDDPDIIMRLALSEHDLGDRETARKLYRKIIERAEVKSIVQHMDEYVVSAMKGLRNLKRNQPSPAEIILRTSDGEPVKHPSMSWRHQQERTPSPRSPKKKKKKTKRGRRGRRKN